MTRHLDAWLNDQPARMSIDQVAELFEVHPRTVNNWVKDGQLPAYRMPGGSWFVLRDELRDYLTHHRTGPHERPDDGPPDQDD